MDEIPSSVSDGAKQRSAFSGAEITIVVAVVALLGIFGRPVYTRLRESSQQKAVLNNLHQISAAADNYFLESGLTSVSSAALVGTNSTQYIRQIQTIANEAYCPVIFKDAPISATGIAGQRTITFSN